MNENVGFNIGDKILIIYGGVQEANGQVLTIQNRGGNTHITLDSNYNLQRPVGSNGQWRLYHDGTFLICCTIKKAESPAK
ncbi:MAG: hypothetical protein WCT08_00255 [Patescibacteria group bacterium]|jgi:hypothetical protein